MGPVGTRELVLIVVSCGTRKIELTMDLRRHGRFDLLAAETMRWSHSHSLVLNLPPTQSVRHATRQADRSGKSERGMELHPIALLGVLPSLWIFGIAPKLCVHTCVKHVAETIIHLSFNGGYLLYIYVGYIIVSDYL